MLNVQTSEQQIELFEILYLSKAITFAIFCRQRLRCEFYDSFAIFGTLPAMLLLFDNSPADQPICSDLKEVCGLICLLFSGMYYRLYIAIPVAAVRRLLEQIIQ